MPIEGDMKSIVYLIHFDSKLHSHAQHYIGFTAADSIDARLACHRSGGGARILRALNLQGIGYNIVRTWDCATAKEARELEKKLKKRKNAKKFCPICRGVGVLSATARTSESLIPF